MGKIGEKIVRGLMDIDGITDVSITPYEVTVTKGDAFDWDKDDDLMSRVIGVLKATLVQEHNVPESDIQVIKPESKKPKKKAEPPKKSEPPTGADPSNPSMN